MTRIISSVVANPPDSPKITTSAYGLVVSINIIIRKRDSIILQSLTIIYIT
jgi:hypothetical protein